MVTTLTTPPVKGCKSLLPYADSKIKGECQTIHPHLQPSEVTTGQSACIPMPIDGSVENPLPFSYYRCSRHPTGFAVIVRFCNKIPIFNTKTYEIVLSVTGNLCTD